MRSIALQFLFALFALSVLAAEPAAKEKFKLIHVDDVVKLQKSTAKVFLFDANNPDFRAKNGILQGATLLSSSSEYDLKVLPADKSSKLVFYCANTH